MYYALEFGINSIDDIRQYLQIMMQTKLFIYDNSHVRITKTKTVMKNYNLRNYVEYDVSKIDDTFIDNYIVKKNILKQFMVVVKKKEGQNKISFIIYVKTGSITISGNGGDWQRIETDKFLAKIARCVKIEVVNNL